MQISEVLKLDKKEMHAKLAELRKDLAKHKLNMKMGKTNQTHLLSQMRRDISRIMMAINKK